MTPADVIHAGAFAAGAIVGSFANVCIHRLPRGESVVTPPSRCPACGSRIRFYDNVPILSWLVLRGRCRSCHAPVSVRYPLVEGMTALGFLGASLTWGPSAEALAGMLLGAASLILVATDLESRILPDEITLGTLALALLLAAVRDVGGRPPGQPFRAGASVTLEALLGAAVGAGFLLAVRALYLRFRGMEGMGLGDVKMIAMIGSLTGPAGVVVALFLASLCGTILGGVAAAVRHLGWALSLRRARAGGEARGRRGATLRSSARPGGRVLAISERVAEIPGVAREGELAALSTGAARPLSALIRLARRRARQGRSTVFGRLALDEGDFFRVLAVRAAPADGGLLVLVSRADIPFGVFLAAGGLTAFACGRAILAHLAPDLPLSGRLLP